MHGSVMRWVQAVMKPEEIAGKRVIEVGSYDVNGTSRSVLAQFGPSEWIGADMREGPNVDLVCDVKELVPVFPAGSFDVVISTEMLEHCEDWRLAVYNLKALPKPGGLLLVTARGPGMVYHPEEGNYGDYWRFTLEDVARIFADFRIEDLRGDPELPGFLLKCWKPELLSSIEVEAIHG